jgi:uroporphyrinogen III methyltransferase/synthase
MIKIVGLEAVKEKKVIAIGPITGKALEKNNISYEMSSEYTTKGIIDKLLEN